mmetsp:Transcript_31353/g.46805  ORF Transcript_31353/g.46805 Transcript_31353/m.46805 type:complete len:148 (+) Transcript_31353:587-1030(+)
MIEERSANGEDLTLYNTLFNEKNETGGSAPMMHGSMIELGAFNGIKESNSRFFDLCLGWNTLLIEGNPNVFRQLVKNRPQVRIDISIFWWKCFAFCTPTTTFPHTHTHRHTVLILHQLAQLKRRQITKLSCLTIQFIQMQDWQMDQW